MVSTILCVPLIAGPVYLIKWFQCDLHWSTVHHIPFYSWLIDSLSPQSTHMMRVAAQVLSVNLHSDLTCKRDSVGQSKGLLIPRLSVWFNLKPENSKSHEFELHWPSFNGTKLLLKVIKTIIIIIHCSFVMAWTVSICDYLTNASKGLSLWCVQKTYTMLEILCSTFDACTSSNTHWTVKGYIGKDTCICIVWWGHSLSFLYLRHDRIPDISLCIEIQCPILLGCNLRPGCHK